MKVNSRSTHYPYPLAAVITRDRGQEGSWAKHSIDSEVNKGLMSVHNAPYSDLYKLEHDVTLYVCICVDVCV